MRINAGFAACTTGIGFDFISHWHSWIMSIDTFITPLYRIHLEPEPFRPWNSAVYQRTQGFQLLTHLTNVSDNWVPGKESPIFSDLKKEQENRCDYCFAGGIMYSQTPGTDCTKFTKVWATGRQDMDCPAGTKWSAETCTCDWASNVDCACFRY